MHPTNEKLVVLMVAVAVAAAVVVVVVVLQVVESITCQLRGIEIANPQTRRKICFVAVANKQAACSTSFCV